MHLFLIVFRTSDINGAHLRSYHLGLRHRSYLTPFCLSIMSRNVAETLKVSKLIAKIRIQERPHRILDNRCSLMTTKSTEQRNPIQCRRTAPLHFQQCEYSEYPQEQKTKTLARDIAAGVCMFRENWAKAYVDDSGRVAVAQKHDHMET